MLIILGTLPMALIEGLWMLYLRDHNLSVAIGVGFIALTLAVIPTEFLLWQEFRLGWLKEAKT